MYTKKNLLFFLAVLIFSGSMIFAQDAANATANVSIQLKKGLSITNVGDLDLAFNETVIAASNQDVTSNNQVRFLVSGQPSASIQIDYPTTVTLDDGGTTNTLTFTTKFEETGDTPSYTGGSGVGAGASRTLGVGGELNLWLSGKVAVPSSAVAGSYSGTFQVDIAYN